MIRPVLSALAVLLLPGGAVLALLPKSVSGSRHPAPDLLALLADAAALSIAIIALVGLWLSLPGIRVDGQGIEIFLGVCLAALIAGILRRGVSFPRGRQVFYLLLQVLAVAGGLFALVAWRFTQARGLLLPAWVDSVHHTLIVRKMIEYGGLPPDLLPYISIPFVYHYGFHITTALFAVLAGLSPPQAVLWFGQVLNAGVCLSIYRLGAALFIRTGTVDDEQKTRVPLFRGLAAAVLVGFAFQMPAYYLTWGRYTLLTGLVVMGPVMAAAYETWENPQQAGARVRFFLGWAGLFLVHYLAALLAGLFLLVLGAAGLFRAWRKRNWRLAPWLLVLLSIGGIALALPWIWRVWWVMHAAVQVQVALPEEGAGLAAWVSPDYWNYLIYLWGPRHNYYLLGLSVVGWVFALRRPALRLAAVWGLLILLLALPWGLRLGPFRPDLYNIVVFFPAALLLADLLVSACLELGKFWRPLAGWAALVLVTAGLAAWGIRETRDVINASTVFVTPGDVAALDWVNQNTPPRARFLINSTLWQNPAYRGVDGGFWLAPYTGRDSLVPPVLYASGSPDEVSQINQWAERSQQLKGCDPAFWSLVRDANLTYVYVRTGAGNLQPTMLEQCPRLKKVYDSGGVFIYQILSEQ